MNNVTDIFFDLDHTLWDFERNSALAFQEVFNKNKLTINLDDFLEVYIPKNHAYWKLFREDKITKEELRYRRLMEVFEDIGFKITKEKVNQLSEDYIVFLPKNNYLFDYAIPTLDYLFKKYRLHIITNGFEEVQHIKLKNAAIDNYFTTITTSEDAGVKKPHPLIFERAVKKAETCHTKSLMIGDNLEADVLGAEKFGMKAIHFASISQPTTERLSVNSLKQLSEIL
ncbi:YjjG family noncanonical pyrimidine nucleotidase [Mesonia aquimarina]|uniref:YjjG family noncanonical pyrimidine nucleotidase n=1 Tax=Mesonia aquimarina TaxID=1504967 RepID=UPI000EF610FD|nr:YjjG family noncanonical pyrimidine nucleotidase [Mesonia aquimarina]